MDKKKMILYISIFLGITALSMLFSLGIDHVCKILIHTEPATSTATAVTESMWDESLSDISVESEEEYESSDGSTNWMNSKSDSDGGNDIRISDESIAEFYEKRKRGTDLDDRYDALAIQAKFGEGCEDLEKDRISIVRQLKGYLENKEKNGKDATDLTFYKNGSEYFVSVELPGGKKDFHILIYENAYDFENVFVTG